jgi:hypothetical protein
MPEKTNPQLAPGKLPDGYSEVLCWNITGKPIRVIGLQILGVFAFITFGLVFSAIVVNLGKIQSQMEIRFGLVEMALSLGAILLTFVLHELTHGWTMQWFGAKPHYGILWKSMMFYATSPGYAYSRNNFIIISLAPFVLLSALATIGIWLVQGTLMVVLLGVCGVFNASGAIGDLWITLIALRYPATAYVMDERDGIRVFSRDSIQR